MDHHNPNYRFSSKIATENELTRLVGLATLHALQDRFAALGQVTVCICTSDGELVTEPTWGSRYSAIIGASNRGSDALLNALRELAANPGSEVPSVCHEGLSLYAAPVVTEYGAQGVIVAGTRPGRPPTDEEVLRASELYELEVEKLRGAVDYGTSHTGATPEAVRQFADTLADTIALLYSQARRIQQHLADLSIVHDLTNMLASTRNLGEILDMTVRRVVEVMDVKACGIRILNTDTGELEVKAVCNLSDDYLAKGPVMLDANAIDAAAFAGETVYIRDARSDPRIRYRANTAREGIVSGLCVPMTYRGKTVGVMRVYTGEVHEFSHAENSLLRSIASQAAAAMINTRLFDERLQNEQVQRQVKAASEIQRRMMPDANPQSDVYTFGFLYTPSLLLGGDFFDVIAVDGGRFAVCIADVVGKGMPAALLMASIRSTLRITADYVDSPSETIGVVNGHMCRETLPSEFATMIFGFLASDGSSLTFCNAGHITPILIRDGEPTLVGDSDFVVGVTPDATYDEQRVPLEPGDKIVLVTDGIIEAFDFAGVQFGVERLLASLRRHGHLEPEQLCHYLQWDVRRFAGLAEQSDDITILVIERRGGSRGV